MKTINNSTDGINFHRGGFKNGELVMYAGNPSSGKSTLYNKNLCQEIVLTKPRPLTLTGLTINFNYSFWDKPKKENPYKFSRAHWYVAEFDWVHTREVLEWCSQQFGPHPRDPDAWSRWVNKYGEKIHFRDEKDYAWFVLRWGT